MGFRDSSVPMSHVSNARMFPVSSASRCRGNSVQQLNPAMANKTEIRRLFKEQNHFYLLSFIYQISSTLLYLLYQQGHYRNKHYQYTNVQKKTIAPRSDKGAATLCFSFFSIQKPSI